MDRVYKDMLAISDANNIFLWEVLLNNNKDSWKTDKSNTSVANLGVVQIRETFEVAQRPRGEGQGGAALSHSYPNACVPL